MEQSSKGKLYKQRFRTAQKFCHGCVQAGRMKDPSAGLMEAKVNLKNLKNNSKQTTLTGKTRNRT